MPWADVPSPTPSLYDPCLASLSWLQACRLQPKGTAVRSPHGSGHRGVGFGDLSWPTPQLWPGFWEPSGVPACAHLPPAATSPQPAPPAPRSLWAGTQTLPSSAFLPASPVFSGAPEPGSSLLKGQSTCWHMQVIMRDLDLLAACPYL